MTIDIARSLIPSAGNLPSRFFVGLPGAGDDWIRARYEKRKDVWVPDRSLVTTIWPDALPALPRRTVPLRVTSNAERQKGTSTPTVLRWPSDVTLAGRLGNYPRGQGPGIEIAPEYHALPGETVMGLKALLPHARYVAVIRDPVDQALDLIALHLRRRIQLGQFWGGWSLIADHPAILPACDPKSFVTRWARLLAPNELQFIGHRSIVEAPTPTGEIIDGFLQLPAPRRRKDRRISDKAEDAELILRDRFEARLRHRLAPQYEFLRDFFGEKFMRQI